MPEKTLQYCPAKDISAYARKQGLPLRHALRHHMEQGVLPEHFRRHAGLLTLENQERLLDLPVFIAGCGGLGGEIAAHLARLGAGRLYLCDYDVFEESNLNRQRFCNADSLGKPKAETTARALAKIAPWGDFQPLTMRLVPENPPACLASCAIVIDCLDSVPSKKMLEQMAHKASVAWLHGAVLQHEGFACLRQEPGSVLESLYGPDCPQNGAGSVFSHVVAGTAALMISLFVRWLAEPGWSSPLLHQDFSIPEMDSFTLG